MCATKVCDDVQRILGNNEKKKKTKTFSSTRENDPTRSLIGKQQVAVVAEFSRL